MMLDLGTIEDRLFDARDTVCLERARLVTEAYQQYAAEPAPIKRAHAFAHVLRNMSLDLESNPVFAGNTSSAPRAWMLVPEFAIGVDMQVALENGLGGFLDDKIPQEITTFWQDKAAGRTPGGAAGAGHLSLSFDTIVSRGLRGILEEVDRYAELGSDRQQQFRQAMRIACEAVMAWAGRYADAAERAAEQSSDLELAACHRRVADACRHVPGEPARSLFEGLQSITLVHLASVLEGQGMSVSIGLPDRALARFAAEAESEPDTARDLVRAFILKIAANSYQGRGSKTQAITVGGADNEGRDCCTAVTRAFLAACARTPVADPHLFLRWHAGLDPETWEEATRMLSRGRSMPLLVNDHEVVPGLLEAGVAEKDAWEYCIVGCNELGIPGRACQSGVSHGMAFDDLAFLDRAMREVAETAATADDIVARYEQIVEEHADAGIARRREETNRWVDTVPFPFCSACCEGCIEAGDDLLRGMPYPDIHGVFIRGTTNAINALAIIEHTVFASHDRTLPGLLAMADAGDGSLAALIEAVPRWGDDGGRATYWARELNSARDRALRRVAARHALPPFALCHVVRSLHHIDGRQIGATVDGRAAGAPVADSIGPLQGTAAGGPTGVLNAVAGLDAARWFPGIYNLNLTLPAGDQSSPQVIAWLGETFFRQGGQELQVNVLDAATLHDAQRRPERHRDLVVRVAGLNARFIELDRLEQDELIERALAVGTAGRTC
jgi:formate C-acetyltransferase